MKLHELLEAAVGKLPTFDKLEIEEAIHLLNKHCKNALWMLEENKSIYRGDVSNEKNSFTTIDTNLTTRKSQNTSNYYTMILDNHPEMKDFPKRSKSLICSTSLDDARVYSGAVITMLLF